MADEEQRSIKVFVDANCADGAGSAYAFISKYENDPNVSLEIIPYKHGNPKEPSDVIRSNVSEDDEVYFVDTAPSELDLKWLITPVDTEATEKKRRIKALSIWDHHASTKEKICDFKVPDIAGFEAPDFELDVDVSEASAAVMAWKKLNGRKKAPAVLTFVEKMEPSQKGGKPKLTNMSEFAAAAYVDSFKIGSKSEIAEAFNKLCKMSMSDITKEGRNIIQDQLNSADLMRSKVKFAILELLPGKVIRFPIVNTEIRYMGRIVDVTMLELGREHAVGIAAAYTSSDDPDSDAVKVSFRSDGTYPNVLEVVEYLKTQMPGTWGGGHEDSAVLNFRDEEHFRLYIKPVSRKTMIENLWTPEQDSEVAIEPDQSADHSGSGQSPSEP